jgi:site-specific DNA-cytosine methylase
MNILSLFDGISAVHVALYKAGIVVDNYYASEIDPYTIAITQKNYPNTMQVGDATNWRNWDLDFSSIDLLLAGFPCQSWSMAGAQGGVEDERGQLLHTMMDIFHHIQSMNPNLKFLFENVKMKKQFQEYVNKVIGVEPIIINSNLVSAQNRGRQYWTNIPNVSQPEDKGIILKDILIDVNTATSETLAELEKFKLSEKAIDYMGRLRNGKPRWEFHTNPLTGKAACLTANMYKGVPYGVVKDLSRRFHPMECERLQTFPDKYTEGISMTQRFKALGNSWTVDVIAHIFKGLK